MFIFYLIDNYYDLVLFFICTFAKRTRRVKTLTKSAERPKEVPVGAKAGKRTTKKNYKLKNLLC